MVGLALVVVLPELMAGEKTNSVKDLIISILSHEWPLTSKSIHQRIIRLYSVECTYQAVHKQLKEMQGKRIVRKQGKHYLISEKWLNELSQFSTQLKKQYSESSKILIPFEDFLEKKDPVPISLNNYNRKIEALFGERVKLPKKQTKLVDF